MQVPPINTNKNNPTFGYSNILKTAYKQGLLPTVRYGFYGSRLNPKNVTLEHVKPKSQGGKSCIANYVLATKENNSLRGNEDINKVVNKADVLRYLYQFKDVVIKRFNGNKYIAMVVQSLKKLGFDITNDINNLLKW